MMRKPVLIVTSGEQIAPVLNASHEFCDFHPETADILDEVFFVLQAVEDLVPQDLDRFGSGHFFPASECFSQAEVSFQLAMRGFYREAFVTLRGILELGLLSIYWDKDDQSHVDIQNWLRSKEDTPFFKNKVLKGVLTIPAFAEFQKRLNLDAWIRSHYDVLSNYVHIKGMPYANRGLWQSNVPNFQEKVFLGWVKALKGVVQIVAVVHILKYPLAFQYTPLDEKFGLNPPMGSFVRPEESERLKRFVPDNTRDILQEFSDSDADAVAAAKWINDQPDLTPEQWEAQVEKQNQDYIAMNGFEDWARVFLHERPDATEEERDRQRARAMRLERWARETENYERKRRPWEQASE